VDALVQHRDKHD